MTNLATKSERTPRRGAGWGSVAVLGALLAMPAGLAGAEPPRRESTREKSPPARSAKSAPASKSSAKASSSSRSSSSRSQPRASSSSGSSSRRSVESSPAARSAPRREAPRREAPRVSTSISRERPITREQPSRPQPRPRYRPPAERSERSPERSPVDPTTTKAIERRAPRDDGPRDRDRHIEIDLGAPVDRSKSNPQSAVPSGRGGHHHGYRPGHRHHPHHRPYRHRHYYGCGHYGYGPYDPFLWDIRWRPAVHIVEVESASYPTARQGALDLDLKPGDTEIYIDGAYIGVADQFDGFPTYLWLDEGTYELAFYKEGYETIFRRYTVFHGVTIDVNDRMRPGQAVLPTPPASAYPSSPEPELERDAPAGEPAAAGVSGDDGRVVINATPGDAAVYLDGHFVGTAAELADLTAGLIVEPGDHIVDVIRPGYENQRLPLSVAAGERVDLELDLRKP